MKNRATIIQSAGVPVFRFGIYIRVFEKHWKNSRGSLFWKDQFTQFKNVCRRNKQELRTSFKYKRENFIRSHCLQVFQATYCSRYFRLGTSTKTKNLRRGRRVKKGISVNDTTLLSLHFPLHLKLYRRFSSATNCLRYFNLLKSC